MESPPSRRSTGPDPGPCGKDAYVPHAIEWTSERAARVWDFYGRLDGADALYFSVNNSRALLDFLDARLPLAKRRILDFGCGRGALLEDLCSRGVRCAGLEFSRETAATAEVRLSGNKCFDGVVWATALPAPLADHFYDAVLLIEVVEHLLPGQLEPTLAEVRRILRPGGHVFVTVPHAEDLQAAMCRCPECGATFHRWQHMRSLTPGDLERMMQSFGLETVTCEATHFLPNTATLKWRIAMSLQATWQRLRGRRPGLPHLAYLGRVPDVVS